MIKGEGFKKKILNFLNLDKNNKKDFLLNFLIILNSQLNQINSNDR